MTTLEPRETCARCLRPTRVCWCAHLPTLETRTRVVFLQHPREADVPIGTARMAHLCLPRSELHVGVTWQGSRALASIHADPSRPPALLYPGEGATDMLAEPPKGPITLVVVDGTWSQAKKIVKLNPELAALPRYAIAPPSPGNYRIRREPDERYVSTIEALSYVLGALEDDPERFRRLLQPFDAMVETQLGFASTVRSSRQRRPRERVWRGGALPPLLLERAQDLVCVVAEANAWPYGHPLRGPGDLGELTHVCAVRLATGECFEAIVRPRAAVAPHTAHHLELEESAIVGGLDHDALALAWRAFSRDGDLHAMWGSFTPRVLVEGGVALPSPRVDVRHALRVLLSRSVGALDDLGDALGPQAALGRGRAGRRLGLLASVVTGMLERGVALFPTPTPDG